MTHPALAFDHLALPVRDPGATLEFYADTLGLPLIAVYSGDGWGGKDWMMMLFGLDDEHQIALCALAGDRPAATGISASDLPHYAFAVRDEAGLEKWRERLANAGVEFTEENHGAQQSLYFRDPNDITLEITAPPSNGTAADARARRVAERWIEAHYST